MAGERFCCQPPLVVAAYNNIADNQGVSRGLAQSSKFWENGSTIFWWGDDHADRVFVEDGFSFFDDMLGLSFVRVDDREAADIRVGFNHGIGSWSYIGTDARFIGRAANTMNFGWPLANSFDTVLHEIIHGLGGLHEHQSPDRTTVFDEAVVLRDMLARGWSEADVRSNIFDVAIADVSTGYDIESIMHYSFPASWIDSPEPYASSGVPANRVLSDDDMGWLVEAYPPLSGLEGVVVVEGAGRQSVDLGFMSGINTILMTGVGWRSWSVFVDGRLAYEGNNFRDGSVKADVEQIDVHGEIRVDIRHADSFQRTAVQTWEGDIYGPV